MIEKTAHTHSSVSPLPLPSPLRLLLIEDLPTDSERMIEEIREAGLAVITEVIEKREEFARRVLEERFDLILTDYRLRDWLGTDTVSMLNELGLDIPVILVAGALGEETAVESLKLGVADFVLKSNLPRLPMAISRALQEKALREQQAQADAALRFSEDRLRTIIEAGPDGIMITGADGRWTEMNSAGLEMIEADSLERVLGSRLEDMLAPEYRRQLDQLHERVLAGGEARLEYEIIGQKGSRRWLETHAVPLQKSEGRITAVLAVSRDITDRRLAEERLRESEARYRSLFENATPGIFRSTLDGHLLDVNPALASMLGYSSPVELVGINLVERIFRDARECVPLVEQCLRVGKAEAECEWNRKDAKTICVRLSARRTPNQAHAVGFLEVLAEDVTERRALEKQLLQTHKFEAIGQLAGGIAHDFNNMIGANLGWAELGLQETPSGSPPACHF